MGYTKLTYREFMDHPAYWAGWGIRAPLWAEDVLQQGGKPTSAIDFYTDIFRGRGDLAKELPQDSGYAKGEFLGIFVQKEMKITEQRSGMALMEREAKAEQGIGLDEPLAHIDIDTSDLTEEEINHKPKVLEWMMSEHLELLNTIDESEDFIFLSPMTYAGRNRTAKNTHALLALALEIDFIKGPSGIRELFYSWQRKTMPMPRPTYVVCSGTGLHLYFVFDAAVPMYPNNVEAMSRIKAELQRRFWNPYVTRSHKVQYQSILQGFRAVGSKAKANCYVMAFKTGPHVSMEYINRFVPENMRIPASCLVRAVGKTPMEKAKKQWPVWYQKRIVEGQKRGTFKRNPALYEWWKTQILLNAEVGHRYYCLENLCSLGVQCNIPKEQMENDAREVAAHFENLTVDEKNHFTDADVKDALRTYYQQGYGAYNRKIEYIAQRCGFPIERAKRNGKTREMHLKIARAIEDAIYDGSGKDWRDGNGRKPKKDIVQKWRREHPDGKKIDCERETGLSRHTVLKWWDAV